MREMYRAVGGASGLRTDVDPDVVNATIVGPLLYHLFATGEVPGPELARDVVDLVLDGLRPRPARPGSGQGDEPGGSAEPADLAG